MKRAKNGSVPRQFDEGFKSAYQKLKDKYELLVAERKEVGACCDLMENTWRACAAENQRIHKALEKLCEHRHGTRMCDADLLCDAIDDTLMAIWGNTIGPEVKP